VTGRTVPVHDLPMAKKTFEQVEAMQHKAVLFADNVLDDPDLADELADLSPEEYADRKRITIENPHKRTQVFVFNNPTNKGKNTMALPTRAELQDRIDELEEKLEAIAGLASDEEEEDDEDEEDDDEE
jgi:hypothetical protein